MDNFRTRKKKVVDDGKGVKLGGRVGGKAGDPASGTAAKVASQDYTKEQLRPHMKEKIKQQKQREPAQEKRRKLDKTLFALNMAGTRASIRKGEKPETESVQEIVNDYVMSKEEKNRYINRLRARNWVRKNKKGE